MQPKNKVFIPLIVLFTVISGGLIVSNGFFAKHGIDSDVLIIANIIFFLLNLLAFFMQRKALQNSNPNVFVRSVMGGMLIKMAVVVTAVIVYRLIAGNGVSKVSVFAAMFLYLIYLGVEVAVITKLNRQKNG